MMLLLPNAFAMPKPSPPPGLNDPGGWSAAQATGKPDVPTAGDSPMAWASAVPNGGTEWLMLTWPKSVEVAEVRIRENLAPGAVSRVFDPHNDIELWAGSDPTRKANTDFVVKPEVKIVTNTLRIDVDTGRVPGWNEIDAVELVGKDGSRQWASTATASSSYGVGSKPSWTDPLLNGVGQTVTVHLRGGTKVEGTLEGVLGEFLSVKSGTRTTLVKRDAIDEISW